MESQKCMTFVNDKSDIFVKKRKINVKFAIRISWTRIIQIKSDFCANRHVILHSMKSN